MDIYTIHILHSIWVANIGTVLLVEFMYLPL